MERVDAVGESAAIHAATGGQRGGHGRRPVPANQGPTAANRRLQQPYQFEDPEIRKHDQVRAGRELPTLE